ncbi:MAG: hypothetical protein RR197_02495, partial [Oscillospiraceae bacterium]
LIALTIRLNRTVALGGLVRAILLAVLLVVLYTSTYAKKYCEKQDLSPEPATVARGRICTQISRLLAVAAVLALLFL